MWKLIREPSKTSEVGDVIIAANLGGLIVAFSVLAALAVTLPHSPANMPYVWPDGGMFLYAGARILEGGLPYREVWDHKPPLVYYLNALGLWLTPGSRWGVWGLEALAVFAATVLSVNVLRRAFGLALALLVTVIYLITFFSIIEDGNLTETFVLPLQFACLALAYTVETNRAGVYRWRGFLIGIFLALIFFLKSNEIGIGIAIAAYILLKAFPQRTWRHAAQQLAFIAGGFALVTTIALLTLAAQNNLGEFWRAAIVFNVIYARQFDFWASRFDALAAGHGYLVGSGLILFALLGFIIGANTLLFARERLAPRVRPLLTICALALPIELVLVTTTGRPFDHYFAALLYVVAVWAAFFFFTLFQVLQMMLADAPPRAQQFAAVSFGVVIVLTLLPALRQNFMWAQTLHQLEPPAVVQFLREHTSPDDTVLVLGYEPRILFFAGRRAPTRFVNTGHLLQKDFVTPAIAQEFYQDILNQKPAYIVDVRDQGLVNVTPIDSQFIRRRVGGVQRLYQPYKRIGGWMVYKRVAE